MNVQQRVQHHSGQGPRDEGDQTDDGEFPFFLDHQMKNLTQVKTRFT